MATSWQQSWRSQDVSAAYADNYEKKKVYIEVAAMSPYMTNPRDRHVLLWWDNSKRSPSRNAKTPAYLRDPQDRYGTPVFASQVVHLTYRDHGEYSYENVVLIRNPETVWGRQQLLLGEFTRAQRDCIIELARNVRFSPRSAINNCQNWMCDLLTTMVHDRRLAAMQAYDSPAFDMTKWQISKTINEIPLAPRYQE